jgi:hypothetical protein
MNAMHTVPCSSEVLGAQGFFIPFELFAAEKIHRDGLEEKKKSNCSSFLLFFKKIIQRNVILRRAYCFVHTESFS